ncbi:MAG TPA: HAMP domain-containing sensor histidine kinase [Desulfosalsimonadaceae bacterium]|nr:HAMP domain-containing sensor histidine kinase [Desulfosalsimonadaceae bacterium]
MSRNLQKDDHQAITSQLNETYADYAEGGLTQVTAQMKREFVESEKFRKRPHFFFRFASRDNNTRKILFPRQWAEFELAELENIPPENREWAVLPPKQSANEYALEIVSARLPDGSWLQVGKSTEPRVKVLNRFSESFIYLLAFLLLVSIISGYFLSRWGLRPLRQLIETVRNIEMGKMDARVPDIGTHDELGQLVHLFNNMLSRIEALIEGMKASLDNVAHELRTPVTRMHNIAEKALGSDDREQYREALENFAEESDRILRMLNTLMDISEAETGVMSLDCSRFPIKELVEPVVEVYSYIAEEKGLAIQTETDENPLVEADFNRISQVLANLLDNAIKYTPPHSPPIVVKAWQTDTEVIISVTDSGQGIAEKELPQIWNRLYRGMKARDKTGRGLGLGLARVKAILLAHNGWVDVDSKPASGSRFQVHLPR